MGISQDNWNKCPQDQRARENTTIRSRRMSRDLAANTNIGPHHTHTGGVHGGNKKPQALRLDVGNFSWGSEFIDVAYNMSLKCCLQSVRTLVKHCIELIDRTMYKQWYKSHYVLPLGHKKGAKLTPEEEEILNKKQSKKIQKKYNERKKNPKISHHLEEEFEQEKLLACIASIPGQRGQIDGCVLEGKMLEFCLRRKIKAGKGK